MDDGSLVQQRDEATEKATQLQKQYDEKEMQLQELQSRLDRQLEAFDTIRRELTTVRDRQFESETRLEREKRELETTLQRLHAEYKAHLDRMWNDHQAVREQNEETMENGRAALDNAQVKLMMNGLSPVSENGFDWTRSESEEEPEHVPAEEPRQVPAVGKLPPRQKPDFFEF